MIAICSSKIQIWCKIITLEFSFLECKEFANFTSNYLRCVWRQTKLRNVHIYTNYILANNNISLCMALRYPTQCLTIHYVYIFYESWQKWRTLNFRKEPLNVSNIPREHDNMNIFSYKNYWLVEALFVGLRKARTGNETLYNTVEKICQLWNTYIHYISNDQPTYRFGILRACHMIRLKVLSNFNVVLSYWIPQLQAHVGIL